jgi:hypothetical protein
MVTYKRVVVARELLPVFEELLKNIENNGSEHL